MLSSPTWNDGCYRESNGDLDFPGSWKNETASVDRSSSTSGRLRCDGTKRSIVRIISDEKWTGWGDGTVRDGMAFLGIARRGGGFNSARLRFMVEGYFWAARILMEEALVGRFGPSTYIQSCLCCRSTTTGEERGPGFLCLPLFSPFSVSHMFCVHHGLYRTGYHGSGSLTVWSFWFSNPVFAVSKK
jgi:hypothetical protein